MQQLTENEIIKSFNASCAGISIALKLVLDTTTDLGYRNGDQLRAHSFKSLQNQDS
jgi:hypothetical protein